MNGHTEPSVSEGNGSWQAGGQCASATAHKVYAKPAAKKILGWIAVGFLAFAVVIGFWAGSIWAFCFTAGIFSIFVLPGILIARNCWITWDEAGFTVSGFWGRRHWYPYEEITGTYQLGTTMGLQTQDGKWVKLDPSYCNREAFFAAIRRHRTPLPVISEPVVGMVPEAWTLSYRSGLLRKTMLIPKEARPRMQRHRSLSIWISRFAFALEMTVMILILTFPRFPYPMLILSLFLTNAALILCILSLILLIRYPQYYSARTKPDFKTVHLDSECRTYHKWSPMSISCRAAGFLFLAHIRIGIWCWPSRPLVWIIAFCLGSLSGLLYYVIGKRHSQEYRTYQIGLISLFCNSLLFGLCCCGYVFLLGHALILSL